MIGHKAKNIDQKNAGNIPDSTLLKMILFLAASSMPGMMFFSFDGATKADAKVRGSV